MRLHSIIVFICCAFLLPRGAEADLASHFGMNPRSMGLGGAYSAVAEDMAALYYNPAGLIQLEGFTIAAGFLAGKPLLSEDDQSLGMASELSYQLSVGIPLSGNLTDYLAFGVSLTMPWGQILNTKLYSKQQPYFVLYDASVHMLQLRFGIAGRIPWKPLSFITFGFATQVLGSMTGGIGFYAPYQRGDDGVPSDPDARLETWANIEVPTATFFTAGMMAELGENVRVGLTYRQEQFIEVVLPISFNTKLMTSDDAGIGIPVNGMATYLAKHSPHQISLGSSFNWHKWLFSGDLTWVNYSSFKTPSPTVTLDTDKLKHDPGLKAILGPNSMLLDPQEPQVEWNDMLVPRVGIEYQALSWLTTRVGYYYERSPLIQTDFPIYDCDKHGLSVGARASFLKPWNLIPGRFNFDLSLQDIYYVGRSILGSEVGGNVIAIQTGIELIFL